MPRWKVLPDELDPQVREFTSQLRRLVDRSGLNLSAVADRTGYSKTSWERYLNGRLLAPKGAIVALAEVTGTNTGHLTTMWELAERAWSRSEMRHDMTMEAIRISQARAALGEFGPAPAGTANGRSAGRTAAPAEPVAPEAGAFGSGGFGSGGSDRSDARRPAFVPQQPGPGHQAPPMSPPAAPSGPRPTPSPGQGRGKRKVTMFLAGLVGALLVIAAAVLLTDLGGDGDGKPAARTPSAAPATSSPPLPAGVKCSGKACTGQDPEVMGCGGEFAKTVSRVTVGKALVEVRYSKTCQAAWARITQAAPGDTVQISVGGKGAQEGLVNADNDAYTPMTAVATQTGAKACATLRTGTTGCTAQQ
ncbi:XRE family transcriptional regulator [Streptomyces lunaelactis]|uniref:helix-turn-helix domain-containing protein n=1 Tax=Streptomyces lunaelactis TaxID=1535768 RepID=UPI00158557A1|nr:XRE family transcriptional regulator [Streptomyces lunaelactis]NUK70562.1 XRE family transcriptional regulator [Streptomyces lunaelactis]NUK76667.1 XRE family transcriptional regulator [Streptomyces lunaelactis]